MDPYTVLGVSRAASADEIERAYRRLARRCHPGVNPGDQVAAEAYRHLLQAYGVLSDVTRRQEYDHGDAPVPIARVEAAVSFEGFNFSAPAEGPLAATFSELFADVFQDAARRATAPPPGGALDATLSVSFLEAVRGGQFALSILRHERCGVCGGEGETARSPVACPQCGGDGTRRWARGHMVFTKACETCDGSGQVARQTCRACAGEGAAPRSEVVTIALPPGIEPGARVVVPGRGHAGTHGGPAGDLYVSVEVGSHPFFRRDGRDLHLTLPVAVHEAALGSRVDVPTLDGPVRLKVPPGTSSGQRFTLRGHGVPSPLGPGQEGAGDLVVEIQIVLPPIRDSRSRELLKEFGRLNDADVRRHLFAQS